MRNAGAKVTGGVDGVTGGAAKAEAQSPHKDAHHVGAVTGRQGAIVGVENGKDAEKQHERADNFAQEVLAVAADGRGGAENSQFEAGIFSGCPMGQIGKPDNGSSGEAASNLRKHGYESLACAVDAKHGFGQGHGRIEVSLGRAKRYRGKYAEHDAKSPACRDNNPAAAVALGVFKQNAGNNASTKGNQHHRSKKFTKKVGHGHILHKLLIW